MAEVFATSVSSAFSGESGASDGTGVADEAKTMGSRGRTLVGVSTVS
jgi:hypothetical protein